MSEKRTEQTHEQIWNQYERGVQFKQQLNLYDTVRINEDFYVGKQWEGVQSNGLPTPVFNYIKRIVLYLVASTATDNLKLHASPLAAGAGPGNGEQLCRVINDQFEAIFEGCKMGRLVRQFMRAAAVDGDSCFYSWFDPAGETGQDARGTIRTEVLENTRVIFGNPNTGDVQSQPYIIISRREMLRDVKEEVRAAGGDPDGVRGDSDEAGDRFDAMTDGKVTTLMKFRKDPQTGTVWAIKTVNGAVVRREWDTGQRLYPIAWMSWDKVTNCYHGQAAVTGLIPNQIFVNKMFAMTMISLMTTAYPKVIYNKNCISRWDNGVGKAIPVSNLNGSIHDVAKTIDPAVVSPQVSQFIELAIGLTKEFMGATDAALGNVRPDNTSAILALQKASQVPMELTRQDLYQCIEEVAAIWMDLMRTYYGVRLAEPAPGSGEAPELFDFGVLEQEPLTIRLDVGGSAYWSEIAQMNTLDNLLMQGKIDVVDYLERVPSGFISNQQELVEKLKADKVAAVKGAGMLPVPAAGQALPGR